MTEPPPEISRDALISDPDRPPAPAAVSAAVSPALPVAPTPWGVGVGLLLLTGFVYAQAATFGFVNLDDGIYVTENPYVRGISTESIAWAWSAESTQASGNWHPLTWMSLQLDAQLWGTGPAGFHVVNVLLHAVNGLLLLSCLRLATGSTWRSAAVAALFLVHPLHVESVAWISERKDMLSTLFGLLAVSAYLRHVIKREPGWLFLTGLMLACSLLSKPMWVTLPGMLLLLDFWPLSRLADRPAGERWRTLLQEKAGLTVVALLFSAVAVVAQQAGSAVQSMETFPLAVRLMNAAAACGLYLGRMVFPVHLAAFYPHPGWNLPFWLWAGSLVALAFISGGCWRLRQSSPWLLFGWAWFLVTILPVIGLIQVGTQMLADRYTYIPLVGPFVALVWLVGEFATARKLSAMAAGLGAGVIVALAILAQAQCATWKNSETLFRHAVAVTSDNAFCENNLGLALEQRGDVEGALAHYRRALEIEPNRGIAVSALCNLGRLLQSQGDLPAARERFEEALRIDRLNPQANRLLAGLFVAQGDADRAIEFYRQAIDLAPGESGPRENLAAVLRSLGRSEEALHELQQWQQVAPSDPRLYNSLAAVMVDLQRPQEAENLYLKALQLDPKYAQARNNLGILKHRLGDFEGALEHFRLAYKLAPADKSIVENLTGGLINAGVAAAREDRSLDAKTLLDEALVLSPHSFFAHHRLGRIAADKGFLVEARRSFEAALSPDTDRRRVQAGDLAICHHELGLLLIRLGELQEAKQQFEKTLEFVPGFEGSVGALEHLRTLQQPSAGVERDSQSEN